MKERLKLFTWNGLERNKLASRRRKLHDNVSGVNHSSFWLMVKNTFIEKEILYLLRYEVNKVFAFRYEL